MPSGRPRAGKRERPVANRIQSGNHFGFHLAPPADNATNELLTATEALNQDFASTLKTFRDMAAAAANDRMHRAAAVERLLGVPLLTKLRRFSLRQRASARTDAARRRARDASRQLLQRNNFTPDDLKRLRREATPSHESRVQPRTHGEKRRLTVLRENEVPDSVLHAPDNPWIIRTPPYDGWYSVTWWERVGGSDPTIKNYAVTSAGRVGHESAFYDYSAGDEDSYYLASYNAIGVWFEVTKTPKNQLDMWVRATCDRFRYKFWLDDEWGVSDSDTVSNHYFDFFLCPSFTPEYGVHILSVPDIINSMWFAHVAGSPDSDTSSGAFVAPGTVRWMHYTYKFTKTPYDGWYVLWVGTQDLIGGWYDDVSCKLGIKDRWFIDQIKLELS